jgi:voltage-gated potassium channel Kch
MSGRKGLRVVVVFGRLVVVVVFGRFVVVVFGRLVVVVVFGRLVVVVTGRVDSSALIDTYRAKFMIIYLIIKNHTYI